MAWGILRAYHTYILVQSSVSFGNNSFQGHGMGLVERDLEIGLGKSWLNLVLNVLSTATAGKILLLNKKN
jgi:hypothetical protein